MFVEGRQKQAWKTYRLSGASLSVYSKKQNSGLNEKLGDNFSIFFIFSAGRAKNVKLCLRVAAKEKPWDHNIKEFIVFSSV